MGELCLRLQSWWHHHAVGPGPGLQRTWVSLGETETHDVSGMMALVAVLGFHFQMWKCGII